MAGATQKQTLGSDGKGYYYDLARHLDTCGVWRTWLGDSLYSSFSHYLSSPSSWQAFMASNHTNHNHDHDSSSSSSSSKSTSKSHLHLQLRVRALLFDKSLSLSSSSSSSFNSSLLNPSCLQLHGDDVYFTLEDAASHRDSKVQSQRFSREDLPDTWYHQFIENYKTSKPYMISLPNQGSDKRNPIGMSNYLKLAERHKKRRLEFKEDESGGFGNSLSENSMQYNANMDEDTSSSDSSCFFPETMFVMNCVPDSAVAPRTASDDKQKVEFFGVLDTLPQVATKSSIMLERLGIRPEYLGQQGSGQSRTKVCLDGNRRQLGQEQAMQLSKKVVARVLTKVGFEGASEIPVQVLSQFLSCHISKLGHILKVLADSYKKQCSAMELLKMFLHISGNSNLASLAEYVKDTRNIVQQTPQQIQSMQSQLSSPQQNTLQLPQQIPRQMNPQMPHPQNLTLQQQQQFERMQRRQVPSPRPAMSMEKDRPVVEVKQENPPDLPLENNAFNAMNSRNAQMQWRHQQMQRFIGSTGNQMRLPASMQMPMMQSSNIGAGALRAPPVKVEGFSELMGGGDTSLKQAPDENKLTSPSK